MIKHCLDRYQFETKKWAKISKLAKIKDQSSFQIIENLPSD